MKKAVDGIILNCILISKSEKQKLMQHVQQVRYNLNFNQIRNLLVLYFLSKVLTCRYVGTYIFKKTVCHPTSGQNPLRFSFNLYLPNFLVLSHGIVERTVNND